MLNERDRQTQSAHGVGVSASTGTDADEAGTGRNAANAETTLSDRYGAGVEKAGVRADEPEFLIWWTNQSDCERIVPLDTWPVYLYEQYRSRMGRYGRGRLWVSRSLVGAPFKVDWDDSKWTCQSASECAGIVIKAEHVSQVQFLPGLVTTTTMELPTLTTGGTHD